MQYKYSSVIDTIIDNRFHVSTTTSELEVLVSYEFKIVSMHCFDL